MSELLWSDECVAGRIRIGATDGQIICHYEARIAAMQRELNEVEQVLGRALGYPRFCDDQANFLGTTDADGVTVGEHVPVTLAQEAAERIKTLEADAKKVGIYEAYFKRMAGVMYEHD